MKMKKTIILICCIIIASMGIALTGCGNSSDESSSNMNAESSANTNPENQYLGTWEGTVITSSDGEVLYDFSEGDEVCVFTFNDDHTLKIQLADDLYDATWELTEDGIKITDTDGVQTNIYYKDGELLWTLQVGDIEGTYHLAKKQ